MSEFKILHLSDFHIGNPKWSGDANEVLKPLIEDIRRQTEDHGIADLVVISGDLVFGLQNEKPKKLEEQFSDARQLLGLLGKAAGYEGRPLPLFIVPGNHDVNRDVVTRGDELLTEQLTSRQVDDLLFKKDNTWRQLIRRLSEWKQFALSNASNVNWNQDWLSSHLIVEHEGRRIGIAGLNTSWASFQSAEIGKLWIGSRQAQTAWNALEGTDFRIVVTHHPVSSMHPDEKGPLGNSIESKFNMHLHGHEHLQWFTDARGHLRLAAGACYQGSEKPASYSWICVDCEKQEVRLKLRKWETTAPGGWVAFHIPHRTDKDGAMVTSLPFQRFEVGGTSVEPRPSVTGATVASYPQFKGINDAFTLCKIYREKFSVRWEPPSQTQGSDVNIVYWPVKLRYPNVVHAAQAFIAAGLQQKGAEVYLWLDDFGDLDTSAKAQFIQKIKTWLTQAGGLSEALHVDSMGALLETDQGKKIWETLKKWFVDQQTHKLGEVLRVSKLLGTQMSPKGENMSELLEKSPRRLLSPPIVWTCLVDTLRRKSAGGVITLGGIDEQPLWDAWRRCIGDSSRQVGHVYVSTLLGSKGPFPMDEASKWAGIDSVGDAFRKESKSYKPDRKFLEDGLMLHWCFDHCVALPSFLKGTSPDQSWEEIKRKGVREAIQSIPRAMEPWIF